MEGKTMTRKITLVGAAVLALVAVTGLAAAAGGNTSAAKTAPVDGRLGPAGDATPADCPHDGTNSPWVTEDERLDRFQERFDLTDEQVAEIQTEVESMVEENATQEEIRRTVTEMLEAYGVEDPTLGPPVEGKPDTGQMGPATGGGNGHAGGPGPHGPADGSCLRG